MLIYANQGDTVDSLCYRYYGSTKGMSELVFKANQGLASIGDVLPVGHPVEMPDAPTKTNNKQLVQLWD